MPTIRPMLPRPSNRIRKRFACGSVAQSVEQRPFKALVPGSSPGRPTFSMAWVYILRGARRYYIGATENLDRRIAEHKRGSNHTTRRFSGQLVLAAAKEVPSMVEARAIELQFKRKKNPQLAISALNSTGKLTQ